MGKSNKELAVELVAAYYSNPMISNKERFSEERIKELVELAKRSLENIND